MQLQYDEDFVEGVVNSAVASPAAGIPPLQVRRYQREREAPYGLLDPDERNAAFFRVHLTWFREWGFERRLSMVAEHFPGLAGQLRILAFRKARARHDEGAELYVNPSGPRNGVVAIRCERMFEQASLEEFLHHEFMHLADMVTPAFGYVPELRLRGAAVSQQRLVRDRYRLLWAISVDGRLERRALPRPGSREQRQTEFDRAFGFLPPELQAGCFEKLWQNDQPVHEELLGFASDPRTLQEAEGPRPGGLCPLCSCPTFSWALPQDLTDEMTAAVLVDFPDWTIARGACQRCIEIYRYSRNMELPATVLLGN